MPSLAPIQQDLPTVFRITSELSAVNRHRSFYRFLAAALKAGICPPAKPAGGCHPSLGQGLPGVFQETRGTGLFFWIWRPQRLNSADRQPVGGFCKSPTLLSRSAHNRRRETRGCRGGRNCPQVTGLHIE